jgi:hypothetical protein
MIFISNVRTEKMFSEENLNHDSSVNMAINSKNFKLDQIIQKNKSRTSRNEDSMKKIDYMTSLMIDAFLSILN